MPDADDQNSVDAEIRARCSQVGELVAKSDGASRSWTREFAAAPRHMFVPETVWHNCDDDEDERLFARYRADGMEKWLSLIYPDVPVVTQVDDGNIGNDGIGKEIACYSPSPSDVARMLELLELRGGMHVLEIGTGTGWMTALLAHCVGTNNVSSIEIYPVLAEQARERLSGLVYGAIRIVTGDGEAGYPDDAPFDRILATAAVNDVPQAWVAQVATGGRLIVSLMDVDMTSCALVGLDVSASAAVGRIAGEGPRVELRSQRPPTLPPIKPAAVAAEYVTHTDIHPAKWIDDRSAAIAVRQRLNGTNLDTCINRGAVRQRGQTRRWISPYGWIWMCSGDHPATASPESPSLSPAA